MPDLTVAPRGRTGEAFAGPSACASFGWPNRPEPRDPRALRCRSALRRCREARRRSSIRRPRRRDRAPCAPGQSRRSARRQRRRSARAIAACAPRRRAACPEIRRLADRRQRLERMERESAADRGCDSARMKDDRLCLRDRRGDLGDRTVAHGDQDELRIDGQVGNSAFRDLKPSRDVAVGTQWQFR